MILLFLWLPIFINLLHGGSALTVCSIEKTINHLQNIRNVDSYTYNDTQLINFNNKQIKVVTKNLFAPYVASFHQVDFIYLMYNNINQIELGCFEEFLNVRNLNFGVNLISRIRKGYFRGLLKIDFLNFQSNVITEIETGAFDDLHNLEYVHLDDNCLINLPDNLFTRTPKIRNIFLQQNQIEKLSNSFMKADQKLYSLNLADNKLKEIGNIFLFKGLLTLIASNNQLKEVSTDNISSTNQLVSLNLDNTTLSSIGFVSRLRNLNELYISNNKLEAFDARWVRGSKITYMSISGNPLKEVNIDSVDTLMPQLVVLDLHNVPFNDCQKLLRLYNFSKEKSISLNINEDTLNKCLL